MTFSATPTLLPTFVFGPRNPEGRDFQLLAQSGSIAHLSVEAQGLIYDVPLLLSRWGSSGERAALFGPAPAPILLARAALLGLGAAAHCGQQHRHHPNMPVRLAHRFKQGRGFEQTFGTLRLRYQRHCLCERTEMARGGLFRLEAGREISGW